MSDAGLYEVLALLRQERAAPQWAPMSFSQAPCGFGWDGWHVRVPMTTFCESGYVQVARGKLPIRELADPSHETRKWPDRISLVVITWEEARCFPVSQNFRFDRSSRASSVAQRGEAEREAEGPVTSHSDRSDATVFFWGNCAIKNMVV